LAALEKTPAVNHLLWKDLSGETREALTGKLAGMWERPGDEEAFEALSVAGQQGLFLILSRLRAKDLWPLVIRISNVWGEGGVGCEFVAWPIIESTLLRRRDFTSVFAKHRYANGGFYERGRSRSVMHFLYVDGTPQKWSLHFDLYNPLHSPAGAWRHFRHEVFSNEKPDWRMIQQGLEA
jgi:hypothetical protein